MNDFFQRAIQQKTGFAGQLTDEFQSRLAESHAGVKPPECDFYHTMDLGGGEIHGGAWDLRGGERNYLGYVDLSGQRVLEFGPATGHLGFYMERQGASVVCFDLAPGLGQDVIPQAGGDLETQRRLSVASADKVRNGWWYAHARLQSRNKAVYGDIYSLPPDLGRFDVSTFGCTLLHLSNPFAALRQAASVTDKAIIVTEPMVQIPPDDETPRLDFVPVDTSRTVVLWWAFTPGAVIRMLKVLGFFEIRLFWHSQKHHPYHELDKPPLEHLLFTVVGERHKGQLSWLERTEAERAAEAEVKRRWRPEAPRDAAKDRADILEAEIASLKRSVSWRASAPIRMVGSVLRRLRLR